MSKKIFGNWRFYGRVCAFGFLCLRESDKGHGAETMAFFYLGAMKKSWPFFIEVKRL